jgi:hypothetical protein
LRVIRKGIALAGVSSAEGSFEWPYNTRLHLTAPRELFYAARGERVERVGQLDGLADRVRCCWLGAVHLGLSGRAAPQVSRSR